MRRTTHRRHASVHVVPTHPLLTLLISGGHTTRVTARAAAHATVRARAYHALHGTTLHVLLLTSLLLLLLLLEHLHVHRRRRSTLRRVTLTLLLHHFLHHPGVLHATAGAHALLLLLLRRHHLLHHHGGGLLHSVLHVRTAAVLLLARCLSLRRHHPGCRGTLLLLRLHSVANRHLVHITLR